MMAAAARPARLRLRLTSGSDFQRPEHLSIAAAHFIQNVFDRTGAGVILIGMPDMQKSLSGFPRL